MAKELPYFKFEPNQWENGNIQICTREDKGLFIDLCSMYWSRLGNVPLKLAIRKLCDGNATAFDSLINEEIFLVVDGLICIDYLNEQLLEFESLSKTNSDNARIGWEKRRKNATASKSQSESDAIRGEERKGEDTKKGDSDILNKVIRLYDLFVKEVKEGRHEMKIEQLYMRLRIKKGSLTELLKGFKAQLIIDEKLHKNTTELIKHFSNWLNTQETVGKLEKYKTQKQGAL